MIYVGIDLGGMSAKAGVFKDGELILKERVETNPSDGFQGVADKLVFLAKSVTQNAGFSFKNVQAIGIGSPGVIDSAKGVVAKWGNYNWIDVPLGQEVARLTDKKVYLTNDANAAALGEAKFGVGAKYKDCLLITLGTGVGGGIVIDGKLFEGYRSTGAELGHAVLMVGGEQCTCGRKGCFEAYASATALIRDTKRAMEANKDSKLWEVGSLDAVNGKTPFDYYDKDEAAKGVVDKYITMLGAGITNLANEFRPQAIILGGGVCAQGETLLKPLREILKNELFAGEKGPQVELLIATLGNNAGLLGAAALWM